MKSYAVIFTYSFDCDPAVYLFDTLESATKFLESSYVEELHIDSEENGWNTTGFINDNKTYAKIEVDFPELNQTDITEIRIGNAYE